MNVYFADHVDHALGEAPVGEGYPVPEGATSTWWPRYRLVEGKVVDAYPGLDDEAALAALVAAQNAAREQQNSEASATPEALIPRSEFLRRFAGNERLAYLRSTDVVVQDFVMLISAGDNIDLNDAELRERVDYLEEINLLATGRAAQIFEHSEG